jgi:hypothetical protein
VKARLGSDGLFAQLLHTRDFDADEARVLYATLKSSFARVETWQTQRGDLMLIAGDELSDIDVAVVRERITTAPFAAGLYAGWRASSLEDVLAYYVAAPSFADAMAEDARGRINTDDTNLFEFANSRHVGRDGDWAIPVLRRLVSQLQMQRPSVSGTVDWERVGDAAMSIGLLASRPRPLDTTMTDPAQGHRSAALRAWAAGDMKTVVAAWHEQDKAPTTPTEVVMLAEAYATVNDERAVALVERLRAWDPTTARTIGARLRLGLKDVPGAVKALTAAFVAYRADPWATQLVMRRTLSLAADIALLDSAHAPALADALAEPFVVRSLDFSRARTRIDIALLAADPRACIAAFAGIGENYPWERSQLVSRVLCFERGQSSDLTFARHELERYVENEGMAVDVAFLPQE